MNAKSYGVAKIIMDPAVFGATPRFSSLTEEYNQYIETDSLPVTTRDWPKIGKCTLFESSFNISMRSASLKGSIRFTTAGDTEGVYNLEIPSDRLREEGKVISVQPVPEDDANQSLFQGLHEYPVRYCVRTSANDRQGTVRMWLIGILSDIDRAKIDALSP
jgi:hypothetical protein